MHRDLVTPPLVKHRPQDVLDDFVAQCGLPLAPLQRMLRAENHRIDPNRFGVVVFDGDLALGVGAQAGDDAAPARFGLSRDQAMRQLDGERHQLFCVAGGEPEHHSLIPGA